MASYFTRRMQDEPRFKAYLIPTGLIVLAVLALFVFIYIRDYGRQTFVYGGEVFQPAGISAKKITLKDEDGELLLFTKEGLITMTAQYKGATVRYGGGYGGLTGAGYTFSDGTTAQFSASAGYTDQQRKEINWLTALRDYFDGVSLKYKHPFYCALLLILVIIVVVSGMHVIFFPEKWWEGNWIARLLIRGGEPTAFALMAAKAVAVIGILVVLIGFFSIIFR